MSTTARAAPGQGRELTFGYPPELPITRWRERILTALAEHDVIVVCGDTGSGKTTQLPKLCLEAGLGVTRMIGHTQPRRIAARAVAARLAEELGTSVGEAVGLKIRFTDQTAPHSRIKVMTDGILLNEIREDRRLDAYDALIIDEAHERSLNIDFILGYLCRIKKRRPGLKVIITSATIDPERFSRHFGDAPILLVEGRSYPVEVRYRPPAEGEELPQAVAEAVRELAAIDPAALGGGKHRDMLVFLPGERWIRDAEQAIRRARLDDFEVLPLYARLTASRQDQIFHPGRKPRIVLATNIAETSLTVPRIRFVIDSGVARVSRFATRHRVQGLAVEPIAQANAVQRTGRCGRLAPGICLRLYSQEDFDRRPAFTDPEILRTDLAGVLLRLEALKLGHVDDFPFLDSPPARSVNDAYRLLHLLGAMDADGRLTRGGHLMARLPLDPRLARLLVVARETGALREGLVIAAALSVPDAREYPAEQLEAARKRHDEHADPRSDFLTQLALWRAYRKERRRGNKALREWCQQNFVSLVRLREWEDVQTQLAELVHSLGWRLGRPGEADYQAVHRAVLAAFVDYIGEHWEGKHYRGMQDARAMLSPGTIVAKKLPRWLVAAERVATERVYLRTVAQINPRWVPEAAPHLVKREYREPAWDKRRGRVLAREVVTLFGLTLSAERRVDYGSVAPEEAREIFIREALAADELGAKAAFLEHNRRVRASLLDWEARLRSRSLFVGERGLAAFYQERLPRRVRDRRSLLKWARAPSHSRRLEMTARDIAARDPAELPAAKYPDALELAGQKLELRYRYQPGSKLDGITLPLPRLLLEAVRPEQLEWLVPGWLYEKTVALLRTLPKELRRRLVPLPDTAAAIMPELERRAGRQSLTSALSAALGAQRDVMVPPDAFDDGALAAHLSMRVEVLDERGRVMSSGRDLRALQRSLAAAAREAREAPQPQGASKSTWYRKGLTRWEIPDLPPVVTVRQHGRDLELYPALVDRGGGVELTLLPPGPGAQPAHREGVRRLLIKALPQQAGLIRRLIKDDRKLLLSYLGVGPSEALEDDLLCSSADEAFGLTAPPRTREAFEQCLAQGRAEWVAAAERLKQLLEEVLDLHRNIRARLESPSPAVPAAAREDIAAQLGELIHPRFMTCTPPEWRRHLPRFLKAIQARWQKLEQRHPKDAEYQGTVQRAWARLEEWRATLPAGWPWPEAMVRYRWMIEELRVSLFAQSLGTSVPVSDKRVREAWEGTMRGQTIGAEIP